MKTIRITGVPEHFNLPWKKIVADQPFTSRGILLQWIDETRGSGQMNKALREDQTDLAVVLTESFLKDVEDGNTARMIGFHVKSPLIWGIHLAGKSKINQLEDIHNPIFLVSRMGSGSHLMAYVLAQKVGWSIEDSSFKIVDNLDGALQKIDPSIPELFLWEKYTTKPWVDTGELKRIGEIPSPWPCFVTVATENIMKNFGDLIVELRDLVYQKSLELQRNPSTPSEISIEYQLKIDDVQEWLKQTEWETSNTISKIVLEEAMGKMKELGILKTDLSFDRFSYLDILNLV
jgi:hypothetical protein